MRLLGPGSVSTPIKLLLEGLIVLAVLAVALQALEVAVLLVDPGHALGRQYQVTTLAEVPPAFWPTEGLVRVAGGGASASAEPWAYITYRPATRAFVAVTATVSFAYWACILAVLFLLRRILLNTSAAAPFPRANARQVQLMGWAILGMAAVDVLISAGMYAYMRATTTVAGGPPVIPPAMLMEGLPWGTVLAGLAVVILAGIFRAGADLQDEQSLTI